MEHTKHIFKLMGKEINAILDAQTILICTFEFLLCTWCIEVIQTPCPEHRLSFSVDLQDSSFTETFTRKPFQQPNTPLSGSSLLPRSSTARNRGSYMSAHVLLNLFNVLRKRDKMRGLPSILSLFRNEFNKFNNTGALMLVSIYHMT